MHIVIALIGFVVVYACFAAIILIICSNMEEFKNKEELTETINNFQIEVIKKRSKNN
jgi:hypothetical protein